MIAHISPPAADITKPLRYNLRKVGEGVAEILLTRNLPPGLPMTEVAIAGEMTSRIPSDTRVRNISFHVSLNPDPTEAVDEETYRRIAEEYMDAMGYGDQPYVVFLHHDIERVHIHIVSSRVDRLGKKIPDSNERYRSQRVVEQLEQKHHLIRTPKTKRKQREEEQQRVLPLRRPEKISYHASDVKAQVADAVRFVLKYGSFRTIGELNVLLSLYNVSAEVTKNDYRGKTYEGIVYVPTDDHGVKAGTPIHASELGRGTGIRAVRYRMKRGQESVKAYLPALRETIQECMHGDPDRETFTRRMARRGIRFVPRINESGRIYGVTFLFTDKLVAVNGSALGKQFSANVFNAYFHGELRGNPFVLSPDDYRAAYETRQSTVCLVPYRWQLSYHDAMDLSLLESLSAITTPEEDTYLEEREEASLQYGIRQSLRKRRRRRGRRR